MQVSTHTILAVIAYFIIQPFVGIQAALIFAVSSVVIDVDHWFWAIHQAKKWWLHEAYFWCLNDVKRMKAYEASGRKLAPVLHVFHTFELLLLILAASLFLPVLWPVFWGFVFHNCCDIVQMRIKKIHKRRRLSLFQNS